MVVDVVYVKCGSWEVRHLGGITAKISYIDSFGLKVIEVSIIYLEISKILGSAPHEYV